MSQDTLKTTTRQDAQMMRNILEICIGGNIPAEFLVLHLNKFSDIVDGKLIDFDSIAFNERVRIRKFGIFSKKIFQFLVKIYFCSIEYKLIDAGIRAPLSIGYVKVKKIGKIFLKFPLPIQGLAIKLLNTVFFVIDVTRKYKWIFSGISSIAVAIGWIKSNDVSSTLLIFSLTISLLMTISYAWVNDRFFGDGS